MPNVMGREFPYTPEGMAAAQQYRQALGMRDGGPMGFRPVRMRHGGVPAFAAPPMAPDVRAIFQGLVDVTRSGSTQDVAAYIEANRRDLNDLASMLPPGQAAFVQSTLDSFAPPLMPSQPTQVPPNFPTSGSPIADEVLRSAGDRLPDRDIEMLTPLPPVAEMQGMSDFPGYQPGNQWGTGDFYPPGYQHEEQTPIPGPMNRGGLMSLRRR